MSVQTEVDFEIDVDLSELEQLELDTDPRPWQKWEGVPCWGEIDGTKNHRTVSQVWDATEAIGCGTER